MIERPDDLDDDDDSPPDMGGTIKALSLPPDHPNHVACMEHMERVTAFKAADIYGDPMFDPVGPSNRIPLGATKYTLTRTIREMVDAAGMCVEHRELVSRAMTLGWLKFKQAVRRAEAEGLVGRKAVAARVAGLFSKPGNDASVGVTALSN